MPTAESSAAVTSDSVDFIDEDDAGSVFLAVLKQVAYAAGAHADEHLDEIRTGNGEERYVRLTGDGAGQQGLAGSWRSNQQNAFWNTASQFLKLLRFAEELDDLLELFLGFLNSGHVLEGDFLLLGGMQAVAAHCEPQGLLNSTFPLTTPHDSPLRYQHERGGC